MHTQLSETHLDSFLWTQVDRRRRKTYMDYFDTPCVYAEDLDIREDFFSYLSTSVSCIDGSYLKCYTEICNCYNYAYIARTNGEGKKSGGTDFGCLIADSRHCSHFINATYQ